VGFEDVDGGDRVGGFQRTFMLDSFNRLHHQTGKEIGIHIDELA
jgi:hypothetical protein